MLKKATTQVRERSKNATARSGLRTDKPDALSDAPFDIVLVFQGGGALGAYQVGVYEAMHEMGIEPDWVIGTSIGAINGALIAGNRPDERLVKLEEFWRRMEKRRATFWPSTMGFDHPASLMMNALAPSHAIISGGIPDFFQPNPAAWFNAKSALGIEKAAYYDTEPLRRTLVELADFSRLDHEEKCDVRLTVGAVNGSTGAMRYFDSREEEIGPRHIMASGALAPAFPAVRIDGEPYWDGGLYSNTPIEVVLDDKPRRNSLIFTVQMWNPTGPEPQSIWEIQGRLKDIQFASRSTSHIERQKQIHRLRHIVRQLTHHMPPAMQDDPEVRELDAWGCSTVMHVIKLNATPIEGEDQLKDIDFSAEGISERRRQGYETTRNVLLEKPWNNIDIDPIEGVYVYERSQ
jgi:NTE family protein